MATRLKDFVVEEVLGEYNETSSICFLGTIDENPAIVTLTRTPIPEIVEGKLPIKSLRLLESNGIYSWALVTVLQDIDSCPSAKVDVIWPATETHIAKHRRSPVRLITETLEMYERVVVPYIETMRGDRLDWVKAILHQKAEAERVLYRDDNKTNGFVLLPNSKWDGKTIGSLYLLVIAKREDLASIRDLREEHLPLLDNIRSKVLKVVEEKYGLEPSQIKLYFHYQPSYYHLHVHVAHVNYVQNDMGRSILFDNVVDIVSRGGYRNISYLISEGHQLWSEFKKYPGLNQLI